MKVPYQSFFLLLIIKCNIRKLSKNKIKIVTYLFITENINKIKKNPEVSIAK